MVRLPLRQLAIIAVLLALLAATLARLRRFAATRAGAVRPGQERADPYISNGDIYVGDPVTGKTRLLVTSPRGTNPSDRASRPMAPGSHSSAKSQARLSTQVPVDIYVVGDDGTGLTRINASPIQECAVGELDARWSAHWRSSIRSMAGTSLELLDADGSRHPLC